MRNLKRALSLTLASVMLLGMMVIGTSAVSYPDVDDSNNVEAIEVLQAVGVMQGDDKGNFDPDRTVSRNEMAIVMAKLLDLDYNYYSESCPFWDVPDYAKPYVGACYANGIVSGYNATQYGGSDTVTAVQAASMMMRALGYFKYDSDYKDGFVIATVRQASRIGLFADINANQDTPLTRDQVAQLALNTLESTVVDAKDNTLNISGESGGLSMSVTGGQVDYIVRTSSQDFAKAINDNRESNSDTSTTGVKGWTVELAEQLYNGDLKKDVTKYKSGVADDFDRPATRWTYKYSEIGTYADTADYTYTTSISGDTAADKVKNMGLKGYKWDGAYYENGYLTSVPGENDAALGVLAKDICDDGVLVEVFMDDDDTNKIDRVSVIRTQMMQVSSVNSSEVALKKMDDDKRDNGQNISLRNGSTGFLAVKVVKEDDAGYDVLKDLKKDDYVLITPVEDTSGVYKVASAVVPETVTGKLTSIYTKSNDNKVQSIVVNGETYKMSDTWTSEDDSLYKGSNLNNRKDATAYLDTYGYAIYVKDVQASNDVIIVDQVFNSLVDGKIVTYLEGWDINGEEVTLNLGTGIDLKSISITGKNATQIQGTVWEYTATTTNDAEYALVARSTDLDANKRLVFTPAEAGGTSTKQWIQNGQFFADVLASTTNPNYATNKANNNTIPMASDVKFIFLNTSDNSGSGIGHDVLGLTIHDGVTAVGEDNSDGAYGAGDTLYGITYILNADKDKVIAVVVDEDADAAVTENLIYVKTVNEHWYDEEAKMQKTSFEAYDDEGVLLNGNKYSRLNKKNDGIGNAFYTYSENSNGTYNLTAYTRIDRATSVKVGQTLNAGNIDGDYFNGQGRYSASDRMNAKGAIFKDLVTDDDLPISSMDDVNKAIEDGKVVGFEIAYIYNGSDNGDTNHVSTIFIVKNIKSGDISYTANITGNTISKTYDIGGASYGQTVTAKAGETVYVHTTTPQYSLKVDGVAATKIDADPVTKLSSNFSFVMPAKDLINTDFVFTAEVSKDYLPAGIKNVDTNNTAITITYDKTANNGARPDDDKVVEAIKAELLEQGYTDVAFKYNATTNTTIDIVGTKASGLTKTFSFDTKTNSAAYLTKWSVKDGDNVTEIANAASDYVQVGAASVANTATDGASYVKVVGATPADDTYVANDTYVKAGAVYEKTNAYHKVVLKSTGALTESITAATDFGAATTITTLLGDGKELTLGDKVYVKADGTDTVTLTLKTVADKAGAVEAGRKVTAETTATGGTIATGSSTAIYAENDTIEAAEKTTTITLTFSGASAKDITVNVVVTGAAK